MCTYITFVRRYRTNDTRRGYYVHDWGLPGHCKPIMGKEPPYEEFVMPKYFTGDYFQRVFPNGYQHSWPSLFVGANGTERERRRDRRGERRRGGRGERRRGGRGRIEQVEKGERDIL